MNILITGCGCSGTEFISKFLSKCKINCCHEDDTDGNFSAISSWALAAKKDDCPWGKPYSKYNFKYTLHQVRFPLETITSVMTKKSESWSFIEKNIDIEKNDSLLTKSMKYWLYWNKMAEKISSWTYRIEDLENNLDEFFKKIGQSKITVDYKKEFKSLPKNIGTRWNRNKKIIRWEDLHQENDYLTEQIKKQAKQYGYEINE